MAVKIHEGIEAINARCAQSLTPNSLIPVSVVLYTDMTEYFMLKALKGKKTQTLA